ncbi:hypothetical protein EDB84DRAFT_1585594 [Lactarius hengduanensis]|nr:hypothetical protein EDB84DRAFT_1585594 [Lactarius hengduanensis]
MTPIVVQCRGCGKHFTPHGLSQHISKMRRTNCRHPPHDLVHARSPSQPTSNIVPSMSPNQNIESWDTTDIPTGDEHPGISTDGSFAMGQPAYENSPPPTGLDDDGDVNNGSDHMDDNADTTDTNTFEILSQHNGSSAVQPEMGHPNDNPSSEQTSENIGPRVVQTDSETSLNVIIERFPHGHPGALATQQVFRESLWTPFQSQCDWEIVHWAKTHGPTSSAVTELLAIPGVCPHNIGGECLEFHHRDIIHCIQTLFGNPEFACDLIFAPEHHYTNSTKTCRIYDEMHTGEWWWSVQTTLEAHRPGATIIPVIISSNKTRLTVFRGKMAYPVYMSIGNIPKDIRRKPSRSAQMLVGYIPTSKLEGITNRAARRRALANMFHSCMEMVLDPIRLPGETGLMMMSGDGTWRCCHPIFATFVGNYPEQTLVTCTFNGRCPKCLVPRDQLGEYNRFPPRDHIEAINTYLLADEDIGGFHAACRSGGLKPVYHPFWLFLSITPDILHQLLQGVMKYIVSWLTNPAVFGPVAINARCQLVPPHHHITLFPKGITTLSHVTGKEHKDMCRILMELIVDLPLPGGQLPARVVRAVRAILDFLYLAQFPSHTTDTLSRLEDCLTRFHDNKDIFLDLGCAQSLQNSQVPYQNWLHIDLAKNAYRATNRKDEYKQMTGWLERREKILLHMKYVKWRQQSNNTTQISVPLGPLHMARHPSIKAVSFEALAERYGAVDFQDALADYIAQVNHPGASTATLRAWAADMLLPFRTIPVFHGIKFTAGNSDNSEIVDSVVIWLEQNDMHGRIIPSRFNTVLVQGHRIAQLRVVFQLPKRVIGDLFPSPNTSVPTHFAYVEWFSPLSATRDINHLMYKVTRLMHGGRRHAAVIPVQSIIGSVHLLPQFGPITPPDWNCFTVLDRCSSFYVNPFSDRHNFLIFS